MKDSKKTETATARAGFTLVELVVVIAILGILAGVAYPAYTGYIKRAQDAKVESKLSNVLVTIQSALAMVGNEDTPDSVTITLAGANNAQCTITMTKPAEGGSVALTVDTTQTTNYNTALHDLGGGLFNTDGTVNLGDLSKTSFGAQGVTTIVWKSTEPQWQPQSET